MFNPFYAVYAILGLAVLMIVHEAGHYFVARAFGMRVERFAIGIGPTIWRHQPKGSDTIFQVGLIPFLAYVQIAGLNPFEEIEADDKGSYANASLLGRISAIVAGPLANYIFASVFFFGYIMLEGDFSEDPIVVVDDTMKIPDGKDEKGKLKFNEKATPASQAGLRTGDRFVAIDGKPIAKWRDIPGLIRPHANDEIRLTVVREGKKMEIAATPGDRKGKGFLGVRPVSVPMAVDKGLKRAVQYPAIIVAVSVTAMVGIFTGKESAQLSGPLGLMRETQKAAKEGFGSYLRILGVLSTSLAFFNMLPVPALDGGRLMFLAYEAVTRRRPNQKVEAQVHMVGMVMLLTTLVLVTYREWGSDKSPSEEAAEAREKEAAEAQKEKSKSKPSEESKAAPESDK